MRCAGLAVLLWAGCVATAGAWDSPAPDVVVYCTPAMAGVLRAAASRYTAAGHAEVHLFVAPPDGLTGLVRHRARADLVVADAPTVDAMASQGLVRSESVTALGSDPFVLIRRAGERPVSVEADALLGPHKIVVLPDPTAAASFDGASILHASSMDRIPFEIQGVADTPDVIAAVRMNEKLLGLVNRTEAKAPGVMEASSLHVSPALMKGALVVNGQSGNAGAFLHFLAAPEGQAILKTFGLENPS